MNWTFINMPHLGRRSNLQNKKEKEIASKLLKQNLPRNFQPALAYVSLARIMSYGQYQLQEHLKIGVFILAHSSLKHNCGFPIRRKNGNLDIGKAAISVYLPVVKFSLSHFLFCRLCKWLLCWNFFFKLLTSFLPLNQILLRIVAVLNIGAKDDLKPLLFISQIRKLRLKTLVTQ